MSKNRKIEVWERLEKLWDARAQLMQKISEVEREIVEQNIFLENKNTPLKTAGVDISEIFRNNLPTDPNESIWSDTAPKHPIKGDFYVKRN